ncbi:MAG: hypothetical protein NTZ87_01025 [Candidatus Nomurabacteria bacterium]|nr:hypothetical protein [Candidatus Nomurabacteria bacterium]
MTKKTEEKENAIALRKKGKTYSEILATIPVAKSTLGIWLKEAKLSKAENQKFTEAKRLASLRGGQAKKKQRIENQKYLISKSKSEIFDLAKRELFLIGVALYWAEGSKEKEYTPGSPLRFANSDPYMIKLFLEWLKEVNVDKERICFDIYLHDNNKYRVAEVIRYWSHHTGFSEKLFKIYFKKDIPKTKRKNINPDTYFGLARIYVKRSSDLVRKISGWIEGIIEQFE